MHQLHPFTTNFAPYFTKSFFLYSPQCYLRLRRYVVVKGNEIIFPNKQPLLLVPDVILVNVISGYPNIVIKLDKDRYKAGKYLYVLISFNYAFS
jgi:hypothetical protein